MARSNRTAAEFAKFATDLETAAKNLREAASTMETAEIPSILAHGAALANTYLPFIVEWADKIAVDARSQSRAFTDGRKSRAATWKGQAKAKREKAKKER